jgi:hypothetical protein
MYTPTNPPTAYDQLWTRQELHRIREALFSPEPFLYLEKQYAAPPKPREGMIVLADGTDWNPGNGAGYYGYVGGAWVPTNDVQSSGSNSNGHYLRLVEGTQFTWNEGVVNSSVAAGGFVTIAPSQPAAFVGRPVSSMRASFFTSTNGAGTALYTSRQDFGLDGSAVFINTGVSTASAPSFTSLGPNAALSLVYSFSAIGRWK